MVPRKRIKIDFELPPRNWEKTLDNIRKMRELKDAPVDTMGCEKCSDDTLEPQVRRYHLLTSLMLSSQTKDAVTFAAMERLKSHGLTVDNVLTTSESELQELIKPVGFYKRKAGYILKTAEILKNQYESDVPKDIGDLLKLPGVGPKMGYIFMDVGWGDNIGIGVDTHVHRISNRLQWVNGTKTPEETRKELESWLPKELWGEINVLLVGFGQTICLPTGPKCITCLNKELCPFFLKKGKANKQ